MTLTEDLSERLEFNRAAQLYGSKLLYMAASLQIYAQVQPAQGSFAKSLTIMANEAADAHAEIERLTAALEEANRINGFLFDECVALKAAINKIAGYEVPASEGMAGIDRSLQAALATARREGVEACAEREPTPAMILAGVKAMERYVENVSRGAVRSIFRDMIRSRTGGKPGT